MEASQFIASSGTVAAVFATVLLGSLAGTSQAQASDVNAATEASRIQEGFNIAPVPLNLTGKNRALVGLGSYLVNAVGDCNGCHTKASPTQYAPGGNPYFKGNQPTVVDQETYLAGGKSFGSLIPGTPEIVSRNLTPDKTGLPEGGHTFPEFVQIMRTGVDLDHQHPNCSDAVTTHCFGANQPLNGDLLQVMPWPTFHNMNDHDLRAIYEYLSAIPCIAGPPSGTLHNECF